MAEREKRVRKVRAGHEPMVKASQVRLTNLCRAVISQLRSLQSVELNILVPFTLIFNLSRYLES